MLDPRGGYRFDPERHDDGLAGIGAPFTALKQQWNFDHECFLSQAR